MSISRRRLLSLALGSTVAARGYRYAISAADAAASPAAPNPIALNPISLARFVDPLPIPPIARSTELRPSPDNPRLKLPYYHLQMREIETHVHRDVPATRQWSYNDTVPGPTFETRSGESFLIEWSNALPTKHLFAVDHTIHGAEAQA
jgi:spore coat protein A, manganese oxidase